MSEALLCSAFGCLLVLPVLLFAAGRSAERGDRGGGRQEGLSSCYHLGAKRLERIAHSTVVEEPSPLLVSTVMYSCMCYPGRKQVKLACVVRAAGPFPAAGTPKGELCRDCCCCDGTGDETLVLCVAACDLACVEGLVNECCLILNLVRTVEAACSSEEVSLLSHLWPTGEAIS